MRTKYILSLAVIAGVIVVIGLTAWTSGADLRVLFPKGTIGESQKNLILFASILSLFVIIPVYVLTLFIVVKYRASNKKAEYKPEWDNDNKLESIWWGLPIVLICILGVTTWVSTHALNPPKAIASSEKPLTIQVVALPWKWLFIYPEQNIASVNALYIPTHTPLRFTITSDAPMNSFWVPELGGQMYAMAGMSRTLNLQATQSGEFMGMSANISGKGFSGMRFTTYAVSSGDFTAWAGEQTALPENLTWDSYTQLAKPSENMLPTFFGNVDKNLYDKIIAKYMPDLMAGVKDTKTMPQGLHMTGGNR